MLASNRARLGVLISLIVAFAMGQPACADSLAAVRQRGTLRWGADAEGGGPFVYPRDDDPTTYQGFEYELAEVLAAELGVRAEFAQGQWDKLPELLERGDIDLVLNGYEWKPGWAGRFGITLPYYIYDLHVLVRRDDTRFRSVEDLGRQSQERPRLAVLGGSAAESYLRETFGDAIELSLYDGSTDAMRAVELGIDGLDGTVQDGPVVTHYGSRFPDLRQLGAPVAPGYYVALTRSADQDLLRALNAAILAAWQDGRIPKILDRYDLWNNRQRQRGLLTDASGSFHPDLTSSRDQDRQLSPTGQSRLQVVARHIPILLRGAVVTIFLSVTSMPLAIVAGLLVALGRLYGPTAMRGPLGWYVELIRGTPLVLQLYVIFFLLPELGISLPPLAAAVLGLAVNYSAYESEIYRAGLQAVPRGQMEAALSLGMPRSLALRRIIIPQAVRMVIPPVLNDFIALFKDTAVCSVITVVELSKEYYIHAQSANAVVQLGLITALLYLAMSYPLAAVVSRIERRLSPDRKA